MAAQFQQRSAGWARRHALGQTSPAQGAVDAKARAVVVNAGQPSAFDELIQSARAGALRLRIRVQARFEVGLSKADSENRPQCVVKPPGSR